MEGEELETEDDEAGKQVLAAEYFPPGPILGQPAPEYKQCLPARTACENACLIFQLCSQPNGAQEGTIKQEALKYLL